MEVAILIQYVSALLGGLRRGTGKTQRFWSIALHCGHRLHPLPVRRAPYHSSTCMVSIFSCCLIEALCPVVRISVVDGSLRLSC